MTFVKTHWVTLVSIPLVSVLLAALFLVFPVSEYIDVPFASAEPEEEKVATILFVGDIMLDRHIRRMMDERGALHVFGGVRTLLESADLTVGNLEGPITNNASVSGGTKVGDTNNMRFTFAPPVASTLSSIGFDLVSIGNNHMRDFGAAGVESTKQHLSTAGITYIGDPNGTDIKPVIREVDGVRVAFIAYNEFLGWQEEWTVQGVRDAAREDADLIVVMAHWGEEYVPEAPERVRMLMERLKDAGADLVIGAHPHIIGETYEMSGMRAYYSLGNFVFDQYWNQEVSCGLVVKVTVRKRDGKTTLAFEETKVSMERDGKTVIGCPASEQESSPNGPQNPS